MKKPRRSSRRRRSRWNDSWVVLLLAVPAAIVLLTRDVEASHPAPRDIDHAGHVVSEHAFPGHQRIQKVYRMAASIPHVLDGIYCYCACSKHSSHYSLHDCFTDNHGARCDICLTEAATAFEMARNGASLAEVRAAIDALYRT